MHKLPPPKQLNQEYLSERWKRWKNELTLLLQATEADTKPSKVQTSILLTCIGPKGGDIYGKYAVESAADKTKLDNVFEKI